MHLILFDIDGTLIRGKGMGRMALERAFGEVFDKHAEAHPEVHDVHIAGSTDRVIIENMARIYGIEGDHFQMRYPEYEASYLRHLRITVAESNEKQPCPGIPELLDRLHDNPRIELALLTGNLEPSARIKLEPFDLNRYFEVGGFGSDGHDRTDFARLARERARQRTGRDFPSENVLVVGDTVFDVKAGRAHGFLTVGVGTGWASREVLEKAGVNAYFEDLTPQHGFEEWLEERWDLAPEADPV